MISTVFALLIAFQIKHFVCDYPLQGRWALGKFRDDWGFFWPLAGHAAIQAAGTLLIAAPIAGWRAVSLALFDGILHFAMDRLKAGKKYLGRYKTLTPRTAAQATPEQWRSNDRFWWSVGLDQMVHHLTHYAVVYYLMTQGATP